MHVLLVEDGSVMAQAARLLLESEGCVCDRVELREDGREIGRLPDCDLIVLDLMLRDIDGNEVGRRLRAANIHTPLLILSGSFAPHHKLIRPFSGAGGRPLKTYDKAALAARIQAIVRHVRRDSVSIIGSGEHLADAADAHAHTGKAASRAPHFTGREFGFLEYGVLLTLAVGGIILAADILAPAV